MLLIKVWWSVFAPKNSNVFDRSYLTELYDFFQTINEQIIFIHGTWNVWHWFVSEYWVSDDTIDIWREKSGIFFDKIDTLFKWYVRYSLDDVLSGKVNIQQCKENIIIGWDISDKWLQILSSDDGLWYIMQTESIDIAYCLTDIDGILDSNNSIIPEINVLNTCAINFWEKPGDKSWWMRWKIEMFNQYIVNSNKNLWIVNGWKLDRIKQLLKTWKTKGTKIYKLDLK